MHNDFFKIQFSEIEASICLLLSLTPRPVPQGIIENLLNISPAIYQTSCQKLTQYGLVQLDRVTVSKTRYLSAQKKKHLATLIARENTNSNIINVLQNIFSENTLKFYTNFTTLMQSEQYLPKTLYFFLECITDVLLKVKISSYDMTSRRQYIDFCLQLQKEIFSRSFNIKKIYVLLYKVRAVAFSIGDVRSIARVDVKIGTMEFDEPNTQINDAKKHKVLERGINSIIDLKDIDITISSLYAISRNYYTNGKFNASLDMVYTYLSICREGTYVEHANWLFGQAAISSVYLGHYEKALGIIKYILSMSQNANDRDYMIYCKGIIAFIYTLQGKLHEAQQLCIQTLETMDDKTYIYGKVRLLRFFAYCLYKQGEIEKSYASYKESFDICKEANLVCHDYNTVPFVVELIFTYKNMGFDSVGFFNFEHEIARFSQSPNKLIRGMCFYYKAKELYTNNNFLDSEKLTYICLENFEKSKSTLYVRKTILLQMRIFEAMGNVKKVKSCAQSFAQIHPKDTYVQYDRFKKYFHDKPKDSSTLEKHSIFQNVIGAKLHQYIYGAENFILRNTLAILINVFDAFGGKVFEVKHGKMENITTINMGVVVENTEIIHLQDVAKKSLNLQSTYYEYASKKDIASGEKCFHIAFYVETPDNKVFIFYLSGYDSKKYQSLLASNILKVFPDFIATEIQALQYTTKAFSNNDADKYDGGNVYETSQQNLVYASDTMNKLIEKVDSVAKTDASVLIQGDSGVGKEVIAMRIHQKSNAKGSFIPVNISSTPEELFESEFFGHEKGSFTGAVQQKKGFFELANRGTLFIDELGEISLRMQVKLLRVLQSKEFTRVGGTQVIKSNFRLITATNVNLEEKIKEGLFRDDLFYRVNVIPISVAPLRERKDDIVPLAKYFLNVYSARHRVQKIELSKYHIDILNTYHWPGNVRELKNTIERFVLLPTTLDIQTHLKVQDDKQIIQQTSPNNAEKITQNTQSTGLQEVLHFDELCSMEKMKDKYFEYVYLKSNGTIAGENGVISILKISKNSAYTWASKLDLKNRCALQLFDDKT